MHNPRLSAHRQIGFTGGKDVKNIAEEKPAVGLSKKQKNIVKKVIKEDEELLTGLAHDKRPKPAASSDESSAIYKWLKSHPLINLNGLCKQVGIDRGNFVKGMAEGKKLRPEVINDLKSVLKNYGFEQ